MDDTCLVFSVPDIVVSCDWPEHASLPVGPSGVVVANTCDVQKSQHKVHVHLRGNCKKRWESTLRWESTSFTRNVM